MKRQEWWSRAKRWRYLRSRPTEPATPLPGSQSFFAEGGKYLMFANGATLIASIGAIGPAWQVPELRRVFAILVSHSIWGLLAAIVAWVFFSIAALHQGSRPNREAKSAIFVGAAATFIAFGFILDASLQISSLLGGPIPSRTIFGPS